MSTRCIIKVINHGQKRQYYHHCDGYLSGVGWELFRTYFQVAHGYSPQTGSYTRWFMERTEDCDLTKDIDCSYEPEPWEQYHCDIEFQYLLDFDAGTLQATEIDTGRIFSQDELRQELSATFRSEVASIINDLDESNFLIWARQHKL